MSVEHPSTSQFTPLNSSTRSLKANISVGHTNVLSDREEREGRGEVGGGKGMEMRRGGEEQGRGGEVTGKETNK